MMIPVNRSATSITVKQSTYDRVGGDMLRELIGTPETIINIIPDNVWDKLTPSERVKL